MKISPSKVIGIDFGTTNSSIALACRGLVRMVPFSSAAKENFSSRSLLYLEREMRAARKPVSSWTGAAGVERYLEHDSFNDEVQGRLIQSLKSYLSARSLTGTEIFGKPYRFEDLIARILADLRQHASEWLGFEVKEALVGRPVEFVGAESEEDNEYALKRLRHAFQQAGFTHVDFVMEPVAAAYAYAKTVVRDELVLVGDFGGGTTDFSLLRIRPIQGTNDLQVLGNSGVGIAGDAFDSKIVRRLISPALGSDSITRSSGKIMPVLPAWVYANLERWHTLSFLRTRATMDLLRVAEKRAPEPEKIAALSTIVEHDLGYRLHQSVQQVKMDLSHSSEAEFVLEADLLHLRVHVTRPEFEQWIAPELQRMEKSLDDLLVKSGTQASHVDRVFLTGGTSLVPAVQRIFHQRFGAECVQSGEAFTSVAYGLALMAGRQDFSREPKAI